MNTKYNINTEQFQGPLELLLELIYENELEITKISLAKVSDQYIEYINSNNNIPIEEIADFLVIASKLIYIKSKAILPTLNLEDEDSEELEKQLKMYKQFLDASKIIEKQIALKNFSFNKLKYPINTVEGFHPPKKSIDVSRLHEVYELILKRIQPPEVLKKKIIERVVSIKQKINDIRNRILKEIRFSFSATIEDSTSKPEKIVSFLAILELAKQKIIEINQDGYLEEIYISKTEGSEKNEILETEFV